MSGKHLKTVLVKFSTTVVYLLFGYFVFCAVAVAQSPEIEVSYRPQIDKVQIVWKVQFKADNFSIQGRTKKESTGEFTISIPKDKISVVFDDQLSPKMTTLTTEVPYGTEKELSDQTKYAYFTVSASAGPPDSPTRTAKAELTVNLASVKEHTELLRLKTMCVVADPAKLIDKRITKSSDRSITVQLKSSQAISVNILAFENPNPAKLPQKGDTTPFGKNNNLLLANALTDIKVPDLRPNQKYLLVVEEIAPNNPPGRTLLWDQVNDEKSLVPTPPQILRPSVRVLGNPQPQKNESVYVEISAENATSVTAYVIARNKSGVPIKLSDEVPIQHKPGAMPLDTTLYSGNIPVALDEGNTEYQVIARAVTNLTEDDNEAQNPSGMFNGLPRKLFDYVSYEVGDKKMNFTLQKATTPVKITVKVKVNERTLTTPCTTISGASCDLDVTGIFNELGNNTTNASAGTQNNVVLFEITAETMDKSLRSQTASFAISIKGPNSPEDKPSSDKWKKITDFAKSVITGKDNVKLEAKNLQGTGFGGFLGSLVRGFLAF